MNVKIIFDAVDIIDGIKDSFSVHVSMEEDVFSARVVNLKPSPEMLNGKADAIINTASGEIASFPDGADGVPMKSLVISMQPIQSLNGYDHPWPAGGGKNKFDGTFLQGYWAFADGTWANSNTWIATRKIPCKPSTYYTASSDAFTTRFQGFVFYDENETYISTSNASANLPVGYTAQTPANAAYLVFNIAGYPTTSSLILPSNVTHFQIEEGQTATSFAPYSNICPISGRTGAMVTRTGKNLLDFENKSLPFNGNSAYTVLDFGEDKTFSALTLTFFMDGAQYSTNTAAICDYCKNDGAHQYRLATAFGLNSANVNTGAFSKNETNITFRKLVVYLGTNYGAYTAGTCSMQLELDSTATTYEPYNGNTYSIDWSSHGTIYSCTLDAVTGLLTVDKVCVNLGDYDWTYDSTYTRFQHTFTDIKNMTASKLPMQCSALKPIYDSRAVGSVPDNAVYSGGLVVNIKYSAAGGNTTAFKTAMNGVQLCYPLATPITYQLSPQEVETLKGQNHVWSDAGDVDLTYVADTKLYIDNKIAQAIAAALNA